MTKAHRRRLRTALAGAGKVAPTHAAAFSRLPQSHFAAVYSRDPDRANKLASQFAVAAYDDLDRMLERERIDVLSVCTPHPTHAAIIKCAARAGVHVICEKPLTTDLESADDVVSTMRAAGCKLGVISQRRFYEPVRRMKEAIDSGKIGRPVLATVVVLGWRDEAYYRSDPWRGTWKGEGGGVMVSQCTHQLDLLLWFMGPLAELFGYWDNFNHPFIEVEDSVAAVMRFKNGGMGSIVVSNSQKPGLFGKVHVHGSSGASVGVQVESGSPFIAGVSEKADPPYNDLWTVPGETDLLAVWQQEDQSRAVEVMTWYHERQLEDFLDAVAEDREPLVNGEAGRAVVELFSGIYESQERRAPVRFPLTANQSPGVFHATNN